MSFARAVLPKRWKRLSTEEILVWGAAGAVALALILLLSRYLWYLALPVFLFFLLFFFREMEAR